MAWPRHAQTCAQPAQIDPIQLTANRSPEALRHPRGDGASVPAVKLGSQPLQRRTYFLMARRSQQLSLWARQPPLAFDAVWPTGVVAARDLADPLH
jgi:hypothetical protein